MTYSFLDVQASIVGPGGAFSLGSGAGNAEEGITIEPSGDKDVLVIGADGTPMHSLVADKSGKVTVRLLKTSPVNAQLMAMYDAQSLSSRLWGNNTLTITNSVSGDVTTCRSVAFSRKPTITESKEAGTYEWEFNAGMIDSVLGVF